MIIFDLIENKFRIFETFDHKEPYFTGQNKSSQSLISVEGTSRGKSLFPSKMIEDCKAKYFTQIFPTEKPNGRQFLTEVMWWNKSRATGTPGNLDQTKGKPNCC